MKYIHTAFFLFLCLSGYSSCSDVPHTTRQDYASQMYEAFITQAQGKSTLAFYQFDVAREKARKAGENPLRLIAIEQLFYWYRTYANSMNLYYKRPTGNDRIIGEYQRPHVHGPLATGYESEWGNTPEQARLIREFMLGVGEVIAGIFSRHSFVRSFSFHRNWRGYRWSFSHLQLVKLALGIASD